MSRAPTIPPNTRSAGISAVRTADAMESEPNQRRSTKARLSIRVLLRRLEQQTHSLGFFRRGCIPRLVRSDVDRIAVRERHTCEGTRNHESIPALETPCRRRGDDRGDNRCAGALRNDERPRSERSVRTARTVGRDREIVAVVENTSQSEQRTHGAARCRPTDSLEPEPHRDSCNDLSVAMLADQYRNAFITMLVQQRQHLSVPQHEDDRLPRFALSAKCFRVRHTNAPRRAEHP